LAEVAAASRASARAERAPSAWFIARGRFLTTTTGEPYEDFEYRTRGGGWVWERTSAEQFADAPVALVTELRRQPRADGVGEVDAIHLPADDSDWYPLPPKQIRPH
jgi:hypothetical protein